MKSDLSEWLKRPFDKSDFVFENRNPFQNDVKKMKFQIEKTSFVRYFQGVMKKIFKFFLTVNQTLTKKIGKKLEKNLVSSENGCIFASEIKTKKKPKK